VPSGCGHFAENIGSTPVELLAVFDNGIYETVEMKDWIRSNTAELLAANLRLPPAAAEVLVR
jgi:oxalate decarboxylase/phosphoglucose isomerase-like protein (cupin superfamily)